MRLNQQEQYTSSREPQENSPGESLGLSENIKRTSSRSVQGQELNSPEINGHQPSERMKSPDNFYTSRNEGSPLPASSEGKSQLSTSKISLAYRVKYQALNQKYNDLVKLTVFYWEKFLT